MMGPMRVCEGAAIIVGSVSGVTVGAEKAWAFAAKNGVVRMLHHQPDGSRTRELREGARRAARQVRLRQWCRSCCRMVRGRLSFKGVVNVLEKQGVRVLRQDREGRCRMPAGEEAKINTAREEIMEAVAGTDEELMEKYFSEGELSDEEVLKGLRIGIADGSIVPVVLLRGSGRRGRRARCSTCWSPICRPRRAARSKASTRRTTKPKRAYARTASPSPRSSSRPSPTSSWARCRLFKVYSGTLTSATRSCITPTPTSLKRPATSYMHARQGSRSSRQQAGRGRHRRAGQAPVHRHRQHAVRPGQADSLRDHRVPGALHLHGRLRQEDGRGRQDLLRS